MNESWANLWCQQMVLTQSHRSNLQPSNFTWPALGINHHCEFGFDTWHIVASICTSWIFMVCSIFFPYELLMQNTRPVAIGLSIFLFMCGNSWFLKAAYLSQLCIWWVPAVARLLVFTCTIFSIWKIFIFIISVKELPVPYSNPI